MNFRKVNNITGWIVCAAASLVYILTAEKAGSFWDCGEFVSACFKLQLPHPPGAPLYTILGRVAIILSGDNPLTAAKAVNVMNAFASGFTILFLFWTITHFARKLMVGFIEEPTRDQTLAIIGAGVVGGLAYTFTDSFWYSAVEGEVYAFSSFFTGLIFWAALKWERADVLAGTDRRLRNYADRWIVFLAFMMGLSIGVHLLGLLTIPAIVMVYYYRRYNYTRKGAIWAFLIGCAITGIVQVGIIQMSIKFAGKFDILFVNSLGLPFFSGFIFFFLLLAALVVWGLRVAKRKGWSFLRLGLWCFCFMMLGYSAYVTTFERSSANPPIDMNNVDNPMNLVYYLGREQYGSQPLVYGAHFLAQPTGQHEGEMRYIKGKNKYLEIGKKVEPEYDSKDEQLFPRVWDNSRAQFYVDWLGLAPTGNGSYEPPNYADNINWFITYQMGHMYWRYFMWNFAGRQNDIQGYGNKRDGNWISGFSFIDNTRLGDQSKMPSSIRNNKANNKMYLIPFLLGVFGCVYHFFRDRKDWVVSFLLFFFTGLAIVIYLNQPGSQPRERDYAFAGSFYAFAIWIGLAVVGFARMARERADKQILMQSLLYGGLATFLITLMSNTTTTFGAAFSSSLITAVLYEVLVLLIHFLVTAATGKGKLAAGSGLAFALCLSAPIVMGAQEWDDHDRSKKTLAPDIARDYLESCAPNAILFTFGDNDTYPLWYAQEVEGVRPDIRILNTSILGTDYYVNQMRYKVNNSDPIDVIWSEDQIAGLEYLQFAQGSNSPQAMDLYSMMKDKVAPQLNGEDKTERQASIPSKHWTVPVDLNMVRQNGTVTATDSVLSVMQLNYTGSHTYMGLNQLAVLNVIAANAAHGWKRPIYFTSPSSEDMEIDWSHYLRKEGLSFRLVPVKETPTQQKWIIAQAMGGSAFRENNLDAMVTNMSKFKAGGAEIHDNYFDEENRRHLLNIRSSFGEAAGNLADAGRKPEAIKILDRAESQITPENLPYGMTSRYNQHNQTSFIYLEAAYKAGYTQLAAKIKEGLQKDLKEQKAYYDYLKNENESFYSSLAQEDRLNDFMLNQLLPALEKQYNPTAVAPAPAPAELPKGKDSTHK